MTEIVMGYTLEKSMSYRMGSWDDYLLIALVPRNETN
jgi:hypothetical protein